MNAMGLKNTFRLTALFAVLIAVLGTVGYFFMGWTGLVLGLGFGVATNFVSYFYSDRVVLKMYDARELGSERSDIRQVVEELSEKAEIPVPDMYVMDSDTPNAFATGRNPENSAVCFTTGLLENLEKDEIEGVLAHEISHIKNRDTLIQAVAGTIAGAISIIAQMMWFSSLDENRNPAFMLGGMLMAPLAASLLRMAISRSREYAADTTASKYTDPNNLASALRTIESSVSSRPMRSGPRGTSHMFIVNPFRSDALSRLFSTHPPTDDRVQRLREMS